MGAVETEPTTIAPGAQKSLTLPTLTLANGVKLWWPHTHGDPFLYEVEYELLYLPPQGPQGEATARMRVHTVSAAHGVRTIATRVDAATTGRVFEVNGVPIFLQVSWLGSLLPHFKRLPMAPDDSH